MKNLERLETPLLLQYRATSAATDVAFEKRERSRAQHAVNIACAAEVAAILAIARTGSLNEKIALECLLQQRDLEKYAKSPTEVKNIKQGLKDMAAGLAAYAILTETPEEYKKYAATYADRNRDAKLDVPKDGMRYALASQITRLQNRQSLQLSEEERVLLTARRALLAAIQAEYSEIQQAAVNSNGKN